MWHPLRCLHDHLVVKYSPGNTKLRPIVELHSVLRWESLETRGAYVLKKVERRMNDDSQWYVSSSLSCFDPSDWHASD